MRQSEKKTILIADDVELNRKILSVILQDKYDVVEASNGLEAKAVLLKGDRKISLILLDIVMPVMDGFRFLKDIQINKRFNKIPIIFVTSETYEENVLEGIKMGVRDVIAKPFEPALVHSRVDNLIRLTENRESVFNENPKPAPAVRPTTALIVDDMGINRVIIRNALESGYDIMEAEDGKEALEILENNSDKIAIILLDIIMPAMDGITMMQEVKRRNLIPGIPVIAITSEDSPSKLQAIRDAGICEVVQKPFTPSIVRNRVDNIVELSQNGYGEQ